MEESNKTKETDDINAITKAEDDDNSSRKGSVVSNSSGGGSWWGSWINSAKEKTSTVFEAVKNDLDELSHVISTQASTVGAAIENTLKFDENTDVSLGTVKKSLSSFFGQVTDALIPSLLEYDETETILITHDGLITLSGFPKHLAELQNNDKTYTEAPEPELKQQYRRWMEVIEQDQFTQDRLAKHLTGSEILNDKYISLVPDKVSHMDFWQRYLFKRALLEDALANAELAERRANIEISSDKSVSPKKNIIQTEQPKLSQQHKQDEISIAEEVFVEKEIEVDVDVEELENELLNNDISCNVELSEEEQIRLLEEYEQEIQEREKVKQTGDNKEKSNKSSPNKSKKLDMKQNSQQIKAAAANTKNSKNLKTATQNNNTNKNTPKDDTKKTTQHSINQQKGKTVGQQQTVGSKKTSTTIAQAKAQKDKEENSSASDESWEKDFDLN
ncbi:BSD domain-containing protein 1-A-like [Condylostylus longicornis]|uniref:BSD domain-containing protein 1-A-like n=1 Tax=Condylostylus longicornis TaxID=2530218 RepID=UPI00244E1D21|nr:BSD domain-containing protein 1-A-like [Condylostylus longicornis]